MLVTRKKLKNTADIFKEMFQYHAKALDALREWCSALSKQIEGLTSLDRIKQEQIDTLVKINEIYVTELKSKDERISELEKRVARLEEELTHQTPY